MRRDHHRISVLSFLLVVFLMAAAMLGTGCAPKTTDFGATIVGEAEYGSGETTITLQVIDAQNEATVFTLHTDKTILSEVLLEHDLIAGEETALGLWVTTVNHITADDTRQEWWKLYVGSTMSAYGVSSLEIADGGHYTYLLAVGY